MSKSELIFIILPVIGKKEYDISIILCRTAASGRKFNKVLCCIHGELKDDKYEWNVADSVGILSLAMTKRIRKLFELEDADSMGNTAEEFGQALDLDNEQTFNELQEIERKFFESLK